MNSNSVDDLSAAEKGAAGWSTITSPDLEKLSIPISTPASPSTIGHTQEKTRPETPQAGERMQVPCKDEHDSDTPSRSSSRTNVIYQMIKYVDWYDKQNQNQKSDDAGDHSINPRASEIDDMWSIGFPPRFLYVFQLRDCSIARTNPRMHTSERNQPYRISMKALPANMKEGGEVPSSQRFCSASAASRQ